MSGALTLQDLVSHVMDVYDLSENRIDIRRAIRSAVWGYEQATTRHQWQNYDSQFTAYLNDQYDTGTIDVDAAGVVTLTGGTFPSWSELGSIFLDDERAYRVKSRDSDTQVTLETWTGVAETGVTYVLRQDRVLMPDDVRQVYDVWNESEDWSLRVVDQKTFRDYDRPRIYNGSDPVVVTFRGVRSAGAYKTEMRVSPGATTATELDVAYMRRPRRPQVLVMMNATASSEVVTLSSALPVGASVVGSLLRHSGGWAPTADDTFGLQTPNLATFEGEVTVQSSTTSITVPGLGDFTDECIVITDVLDIPPYLLLPTKMYAEAQMARIGSSDFKMYRALQEEADEHLRYAMEQDAPYDRRSTRPVLFVDHLASMQDLYIVES